MTINVDSPIEQIFQELRELGAVKSTDDFSVNWLGMDKSYLRCIRARHREPTVKILAKLSGRLRKASIEFSDADKPLGMRRVGKRFRQLADICAEKVFAESEG